jgi:hypothetical protein
MKKILIKKSETADTRSCDCTKVTKEQLLASSKSHISDVQQGMKLIADIIIQQGKDHDFDKLSDINKFYNDFKTNFQSTEWYENHKLINRHHLSPDNGVIPEDVNLIDVLEYLTDCIMAGLARTEIIYDIKISPEVLMTAFNNTISQLKNSIEVIEDN